ncbi:V-type ATPase 116kDa subunit family protein [Tardisphaera miroshnichenkoae]
MLFPQTMERVEIVVPRDEADDLVDALGQRGLVHFSLTAAPQAYEELRQKAQEIVQMASELGESGGEKREVEISSWDAALDSYSQRLLGYLSQKKKIEDELNEVRAQRQKLNEALFNLEAFPSEYDDSAFSALGNYGHAVFLSHEELRVSYPHLEAESERGRVYVVLYEPSMEVGVREEIKKMGAVELVYPDWLDPVAERAKKKAQEGLLELSKRETELMEQRKKLIEEASPIASEAGEISRMFLRSLEVKPGSEFTESTRLITGFVQESEVKDLVEVTKRFPGALVYHRRALPSDNPPTLQRLPGLVSHFGVIVGSLGLPAYGEVDPTLITAITFPLLFALMFPDAGQAFLLAIAGLVMAKKFKGSLKDLGYVMAFSGAAAVISGLAFGEVFGLEIHPLAFHIFDWQGAFSFAGTPFSVWNPSASVSSSTTQTIVTLMLFSIGVGIAQMSLGFLLSMINQLKKGLTLKAFGSSLPKLVLLPSAFALIVERVSLAGIGLALWVALVIVPFAVLYVFPFLARSLAHEGSLADELMDAVESTISFISNSFSYLRLLAMAVAHLALMLVVFVVAWLAYGYFGSSALGWVAFWTIAALGNLVVMAFEALLVFIQSMRLHFYEWMMKFFAGSGYQFSPLSYEGRSVRVIKKPSHV